LINSTELSVGLPTLLLAVEVPLLHKNGIIKVILAAHILCQRLRDFRDREEPEQLSSAFAATVSVFIEAEVCKN